MKQPSLRQEAIRLGFAFLALLIVGLMTNTAASDEVHLVVVEQPKKKLPKVLVVPEKSAKVAAMGSRPLN